MQTLKTDNGKEEECCGNEVGKEVKKSVVEMKWQGREEESCGS